jgi:hypothetical protein
MSDNDNAEANNDASTSWWELPSSMWQSARDALLSPFGDLNENDIQQSNADFVETLLEYQQHPPHSPPKLPALPMSPVEGEQPNPRKRRASSTDLSSSSNGGGPTRKRARIACFPCRRAKQRCDNRRPCSRCIARNREADCLDDFDDKVRVSSEDETVVTTLSTTPSADIAHQFQQIILNEISSQEIHDMIVQTPLKW